MVAGKTFSLRIIYTSYLIICASLKEICLVVNEELMPQDFGDIRIDKHMDVQMSARWTNTWMYR
jgi:hypothetical protein